MLQPNQSTSAGPATDRTLPKFSWAPTRSQAIRIALWYAAVGSLWIGASDWVLLRLVQQPAAIELYGNLKGWCFVAVTTLLLGTTLDRYFRNLRDSARRRCEAEDHLRLVGDNLPDSYLYQCIHVPGGRPTFVHISAGVKRVHGFTPDEVLSDANCLLQQVAPGQRATMAKAEEASARDLSDFEIELPIRRRDGSSGTIYVRSRPSKLPNGQILWEGFVTDVTEKKTHEREFQRLARLYAMLSQINQSIVRVKSRDELFTKVCQATTAFGGFTLVWIGWLDRETRNLRPVQCSGAASVYVETLVGSAINPMESRDPVCQCVREQRPSIVNDFQDDSTGAEQRSQTLKYNLRAVAALPIRLHGEVCGAVAVYADEIGVFQDKEIALLEETAVDISFALDRLDEEERRRQVEEALGESKAKLEAALESMTDAVGIANAEGRFVEFNESFAAFHRFKNKTECAKVQTDYAALLDVFTVDGKTAPLSDWPVPRALRGETVTNAEYSLRRKDTSETWTGSFSFAPIRDKGGTIVGSVVAGRDITEQRHSEEKVRLFRALIERSPDEIHVIDPSTGRFLDVNESAWQSLGYTREELLALTWSDVAPGLDHALLGSNARTLGHVAMDALHRRKDGSTYPVEVSLSGIVLEREYLVAINRNVTERKQAEEELRESECRFRTFVETAPEAIFVRTNNRFAYLNPAALKVFGASSENQLLGQSPLERFHPDVRDQVAIRMRQLDIDGEPTLSSDRELLRLDGTSVHVSISAVSVLYRGQPSALVFARDISDRKRAEASMRERLELQNQFAKVAATVPGAIYSFQLRRDGTMAMPYASASLLGIFGVDPEQVQQDATPILALIYPDDIQRVRDSILTSAQTLQPWREEFRTAHRQLGTIWVEGHSVPQLAPDGSVLWHGFLHDITSRKLAEEQLRKLSRAVDQSPVSIVITDAKGTIEYVNPKFTDLTGYTLAEVRGKNPSVLKSGTTPASKYAALWKTILQGKTWRGEFLNLKKNGEPFSELASISPVMDEAGAITHFLAIKEDITQRKQLEEQFRQAQKMEAIGQLAGGVAHDFNNILAAIIMQADLSSRTPNLPTEVAEDMEQIRSSAERAAQLTRQLLLFSRRQVMQPRDLDLNEVVTSLAKMLQRIIGEDIRLQLNLHPVALHVYADAGMLDQVLLNLAVNARDAMPQGGRLTISTSLRLLDETSARLKPGVSSGSYASISVQDTGCGISESILPRIFEPFFTTKEVGKGTGLGLATVFGIIKQHQGWIDVQSQAGHGATFHVFLPEAVVLSTTSEIGAPVRPRFGTETILLAEDDATLRKLTRELLQCHGYTVLEASDGIEAQRAWQAHSGTIALLLTDLVMPAGLSGQELACRLRSERPGLKVIFTSGYSAEFAGRELELRPGENFLQKPCAPDELLETVRRCLDV